MNRGSRWVVSYRFPSVKRAVLVVLAVFVFAFGLVGFSSLPGPESDPAAASHRTCGPGDYQWLCEIAVNCEHRQGTLNGLDCADHDDYCSADHDDYCSADHDHATSVLYGW